MQEEGVRLRGAVGTGRGEGQAVSRVFQVRQDAERMRAEWERATTAQERREDTESGRRERDR